MVDILSPQSHYINIDVVEIENISGEILSYKIDLMGDMEKLYENKDLSKWQNELYENSTAAYSVVCLALDRDKPDNLIYKKMMELKNILGNFACKYYKEHTDDDEEEYITLTEDEEKAIYKAGELFNNRGGFSLMLSIHQILKTTHKGKGQDIYNHLNYMWDGVGMWQA